MKFVKDFLQHKGTLFLRADKFPACGTVPAKEELSDGKFKVCRDSEGTEYFVFASEAELHRVHDGGPGLYMECGDRTNLYKREGTHFTPVVQFSEGIYMIVRKTVPPIRIHEPKKATGDIQL